MTLQPVGVIFPDAEMWAIGDGQSGRPVGRLRAALSGRPEPYAQGLYFGNAVPTTRRDRMVIVRRDGGASSGLFDHPRLTVQTWAKTEQDATDLARLVSALMRTLPGDGVCTAMVQNSGPSPVPDSSGQPLRNQVFDATLRGVPL